MGKKILSLCMVLALCLGLLPVTALADAPSGQVLYVGNVRITSTGYWTTDGDGNVTAYTGEGTPADKFIHYDAGDNTLTLHNATIKESVSTDTSTFIPGTAIGVLNESGDAKLTITLEGTNTIEDVSTGIFVLAHSSSTGGATLTITGSGSLDASGSLNGIMVQSNSGDATLTIQSADVTLTSNSGNGVTVQAGSTDSSGRHTITLSVEGGSLTASGSTGISFDSASSYTVSATNLTVSNNAIVRANDVRSNISHVDLQIGKGNNSSGGIVFDDDKGTVYGNVTLQEDLTIESGQTLTIPDGASLNTDGKLTVDGGTLTQNGTVTGGVTYKVTGVSLSPDTLTLDVGESSTLTATITPDNATEKSVTWESSDTNIATVDTNGVVTAVAQGSTTIKATVDGKSAECTVTVIAAATVPVESVSLDKTSLELTKGGTDTLTATITPNNASNKSVTWSTSDASVATVTDGVVTAVAPGTATITVTTEDGTKTASCTVTVTVPVTGVTLSQTQASLYYNRTPSTLTLTATVTPDNATNKDVTWTSSNPSAATVNQNGVVTAVAPGTAVITATAADGNGANATCTVTVSRYSSGGGSSSSTYRPHVEDTKNGSVSFSPRNPERGDRVTITLDPDPGYEVDEVNVTDRDGDPVDVTEHRDGTYSFEQPRGRVTIAVTFRAIPEPEPVNLPFADVPEGYWAYDAIQYVYGEGLMAGTSGSAFSPEGTTTRGQIVTILWRLSGSPVVNCLMDFDDVDPASYYGEAIRWAVSEGIAGGYGGGLFGPDDPITREQLAVMLHRYAQHEGCDVSIGEDTNILSYADAFTVSEYAVSALQWACGAGIISGTGDGSTLTPQGEATRAQAATVLMRFCEEYQ